MKSAEKHKEDTELNNTDNFLGMGEEFKEFYDYKKSKAVILPIPYEGTVSYGAGTAKGPQAIINASAYVEFYDEELDAEICKAGIATAESVKIKETPGEMIREVEKRTAELLEDNKFVAGLGGEHSVSQGIYRALKKKFGEVSVLQIDAHSDLRNEYDNTKLSHAAVMRRICELAGKNDIIVQAGIRSMDLEEAKAVKEGRVKTNIFFAKEIVPASNKGDFEWTEKIVSLLKGKKVFITFDIDALDPGIMPSTGTPEPGGLGWYASLKLLKAVFGKSEVVGFDVVELAPIDGLPHPDFTAAKLVYKMIGYKFFL